MNYLEINRSASPCCVSLPTECIKPRCIEVALIIITLTGAALVGAACVSYLPPLAGYVGGGFSLCSLIGLAVGHCCVEKPIHYAVPQPPEASDSYSETVQPAPVPLYAKAAKDTPKGKSFSRSFNTVICNAHGYNIYFNTHS